VLDNLHRLKKMMFFHVVIFQKAAILFHVDCDTMTLCSHKRDVEKYNNILIHKIFQPHDFLM
jgi:hypothetical protein